MKKELEFRKQINETTYKTKHYSIEVKYNERFDVFVLTIKTGRNTDFNQIHEKVEQIKAEINNDIENGYSRKRINKTYKF